MIFITTMVWHFLSLPFLLLSLLVLALVVVALLDAIASVVVVVRFLLSVCYFALILLPIILEPIPCFILLCVLPCVLNTFTDYS